MYDDELEEERQHTEITLSNTTLLLIFLGGAIVCGVFFGFGYSMGKRNSVASVTTAPQDASAPQPIVSTGGKPSAAASNDAPAAVQPAAAPDSAAMQAAPPPAASDPSAEKVPPPIVRAAPVSATQSSKSSDTEVRVTYPKPPPPVATPVPAPAPAATLGNVSGRTWVVQVAAVSHQGDADILMAALRRKGYQVAASPSAQDNLIHVQVGPFAGQKDALAMRDRLSNDGYMAIVK